MDIQAAALVGAGLAIGFGTLGPGIGIGLAVSSMLNSSARQPEMTGRLLTNMFIGVALIEVLALLAFLISILLFNFGTVETAPVEHLKTDNHVEVVQEKK